MKSPIPDEQTEQQKAEGHQRFRELWDRMVQGEESEEQQPKDEVQGKERRTSERYAYPVIQMFAPCKFFQPPEEDAFCEVRCHDISRGGVSFFWPRPPDFKYVVVLLGDGPERISLTARVVRYDPRAGTEGEFLVCCEFLDRVPT